MAYHSCTQRICIEACYVPSAVLEAFVELITDRRTVWSSKITSVQFSSVAQSCPTLCNPVDCSTPKITQGRQKPFLLMRNEPQRSTILTPCQNLSDINK